MRKNFGCKTYLYPMPVLIIGSYDEEGIPNAMNAAWAGICDYDKISIALSNHKTTQNILKNKCFTIAVATKEHVVECDYVGIVSQTKNPDKMRHVGWTIEEAENIHAPIFKELPITMECELISYENEILIGRIINVSAEEEFLGSDGLPSLEKFTPITYDPIHHKYIELGDVVADAFQVGKKLQ